MQVSGEGAATAYAGVAATIFLTLKDQSSNSLQPAAYTSGLPVGAMLQLMDPESPGLLISLSFSYSPDDQALIGGYLPEAVGAYLLQLSVGEEIASGTRAHPACNLEFPLTFCQPHVPCLNTVIGLVRA